LELGAVDAAPQKINEKIECINVQKWGYCIKNIGCQPVLDYMAAAILFTSPLFGFAPHQTLNRWGA